MIKCMDALEGLKGISDYHLVVTSPPYWTGDAIDYRTKDGNVNYLDYDSYKSYLREIISECYKGLIPTGRLCLNIDDRWHQTKQGTYQLPTHADMVLHAVSCGFVVKATIIWEKIRSSNASGGMFIMGGSYPYPPRIPVISNFEYILVLEKLGNRKVDADIKEKSKISRYDFNAFSSSVWRIHGEHKNPHPAPFPVEIPLRLIRAFSFFGDTVVDPFSGSGTTGVAAQMLGRSYIGFDIDEAYIEQSLQRIKDAQPLEREIPPRSEKLC